MDCKEENEKLKAKADDAKNLAEQAAPIFGENCWSKWVSARDSKKPGPNLKNHVIVIMVYVIDFSMLRKTISDARISQERMSPLVR